MGRPGQTRHRPAPCRLDALHPRWLALLAALLPAAAAGADDPPTGRFDDRQCVACHGEASPEVHSYRTSKHGVLARIGTPGRVPGCSGCHGAAAHGPADEEGMAQTCNHCHSPRYVETLQANGKRMVAIGELKQREAQQLLARAGSEHPPEALAVLESRYRDMERHLRNLRLGVAHQSPDYQWWHGHPALDGDLLHLKGAYDALPPPGE